MFLSGIAKGHWKKGFLPTVPDMHFSLQSTLCTGNRITNNLKYFAENVIFGNICELENMSYIRSRKRLGFQIMNSRHFYVLPLNSRYKLVYLHFLG